MKTRVLISLLLMLMTFTTIYASEDPTENEEYQRKSRELKALAEKFKAETGFKGTIDQLPDQMRLSIFTGNFDDLDMMNVRDSVAFKQVCINVVNKLLPYISAKSDQLVISSISTNNDHYGAIYRQIVNGYPVETGGTIKITYLPLPNQRRFSILNETVEIPQLALVNIISEEAAFTIARTAFEQTGLCNEFTPIHRSRTVLLYKSRQLNGQYLPYKLYWRVSFPSISYYIDVETSEFFSERYVINNLYTYTVKGDTYGTGIGFPSTSFKPMVGIELTNGGNPEYTNSMGIVQLEEPPGSGYQVTLQSDRFGICSGTNSAILHVNSNVPIGPMSYETILMDLIFSDNDSLSHYAPNIFHHLSEQDTMFKALDSGFSEVSFPTIINDSQSLSSDLGNFDPRVFEINYVNGLNSHVVRHEVSHFFAYQAMGYHQFYESFNNENHKPYQGMDEAFAVYLLSQGINSTSHYYGQLIDIQNYTVQQTHTAWNDSIPLPLNEDFYSWYYNRYPIASAWWSLRDNPVFGSPDPITQVKAFDRLLVDVLKHNVVVTNNERYKPRYFYNLLMQRVADSGSSAELNDKQKAIRDAYDARGLHFYPKVESFSGGQKGRNVFTLGSPVHVKISNCPQNTPINIYVINHNSYTYEDGASVPGVDCYAPGFTLLSETTDANGAWQSTSPIWTASTIGDYDIIVDIGSPTSPDGVIHFAFSGANVMDGFDGRLQPGFTVLDNIIDVVMASHNSCFDSNRLIPIR